MNAIPKERFKLSREQLVRRQARFLQLELWNERSKFWDRDIPQTPIDVLQPGVALQSRGFAVETRDFLGYEWDRGVQTEVAGLIDRSVRSVFISAKYPQVVQNFTLAHELGHVLLHPHIDVKHRELPKDGPTIQKAWEEREADWFASEFLMPEKQVRLEFARRFGVETFWLTDDTAFALCSTSLEQARAKYRSPRDLENMLAQAIMYGGTTFVSLSQLFGVSTKAMSIRLNELNLVGW